MLSERDMLAIISLALLAISFILISLGTIVRTQGEQAKHRLNGTWCNVIGHITILVGILFTILAIDFFGHSAKL